MLKDELTKVQTALLLASSDMDQAIAAALALETETDGPLARAIETAMAVCYMRAFTKSSLGTLPSKYVPMSSSPYAKFHAEMKRLRDKVYAHTDAASGRSASMRIVTGGETVTLEWREQWLPFSRSELPAAIGFFERERDLLRTEAAVIQVTLDRLGP